MISPDELEAWAKLYDRGYYSFEPGEQMFAARAELDRELAEAWKREVPAGSISFRESRRGVIEKLRVLLKEWRPPTT